MTHQLRYLLIFGDRKKKVELTVSQDLENVKVKTLKQKARELFNLKSVLLQIWDKGFEDWVDLDEGDPTPTNSRIKVELDKDASSAAAAVKPKPPPVTLIPDPKVDSPVVRGLSSHRESYPPMSLTTSELPMVVPTQKSLPVMSRKPQPSKQSSRTLPSGGLKRYLVEEPPGSSSAHDVGARQVSQDIRNAATMPECSRGALWSVTECTFLIGIWCSDDIQTALSVNGHRNKVVYKKIAVKLSETGFPIRPWDRVRDKVNRVKTEYRKIKRQVASGYDMDQIAFPIWYVQIDTVYGEKLASELPDLVDTGHRGDSSSAIMLEDGDNTEDRLSEDDDNFSSESGGFHTSIHDRHKSTRDGVEDEGGHSTTGATRIKDDDDDAWIAEGISEVSENESEDEALDTLTEKKGTARRGVKRSQSSDVRSKKSNGPSKECQLKDEQGERDMQKDEGENNGSKRYHLRQCQVKIEMGDDDDYADETF